MNTITFLSQEQIKCTRNIDIMFGRGWWDLAQTHFMIFPRNLRLSQNTETSLTENYKIKYISGYGTKIQQARCATTESTGQMMRPK